VEGAGPTQRVRHDTGIGAKNFASNPLDALRHLGRCASRECHQQDPARISAADNEMGNAVSKGIRLAGSRAGNDKQWWSDVAVARDAVLDGSALLRIERLKIRSDRRSEHESVPLLKFNAR
jgi:hypothetical protein